MGVRLVVEIHQDDAPVRRVGFDTPSLQRFVRLGAFGVLLAMVGFGALVWQFRSAVHNGPSALEENKLLRQRMRGIEARQSRVDQGLARISAHDSKLRRMTLDDSGMRAFGVGPLSELEIVKEGFLESDPHLRPQEFDVQATDGIDGLREHLDDIEGRAEELEELLGEEERSLTELRAYLDDRTSVLRAAPSIWPVRGWVTSHFGWRESPHGGGKKRHIGLDISAPVGTPIVAAADGHVIFAAYNKAYGNVMVVDHGYGLTSKYAHCSKFIAQPGDRVKREELIARVGNTGRSTGPHLHFEVREDGVPVNPLKFLRSE
jgi:murein DD-endopeptidase MepM/ murein hydrolase activator NlpD